MCLFLLCLNFMGDRLRSHFESPRSSYERQQMLLVVKDLHTTFDTRRSAAGRRRRLL